MGRKRTWAGIGEEAGQHIEYEQLRNARLAENRRRMAELGLADLSKSLSEALRPHSLSARSNTSRSLSSPRIPIPSGPSRRSSRDATCTCRPCGKVVPCQKVVVDAIYSSWHARLKGAPAISYSEVGKREGGRQKGEGRSAYLAGVGGPQPEIYTEEDEKRLGSCTKEWQLFTDGYGADGSRIYDPVCGKTCHQCRQKTMGHRTSCSSCHSLHGQFCGDCLYMRYGENVLEAKENKNWVCPVCRKICNCSFCRLRRGWTPTGSLYRSVVKLGYKSVAHYLVLTRRAEPEEEDSKTLEVITKDTNAQKDTTSNTEVSTRPSRRKSLPHTPKSKSKTKAEPLQQKSTAKTRAKSKCLVDPDSDDDSSNDDEKGLTIAERLQRRKFDSENDASSKEETVLVKTTRALRCPLSSSSALKAKIETISDALEQKNCLRASETAQNYLILDSDSEDDRLERGDDKVVMSIAQRLRRRRAR